MHSAFNQNWEINRILISILIYKLHKLSKDSFLFVIIS